MSKPGPRCIVLLRHAQAEPRESADSDRERKLTSKGEAQAHRIGLALLSLKILPDAIVSSPALRALQTAKLAAKAAGCKTAIEEDETLYEAGTKEILACIQRHPDRHTVWVVGHNPGLQETGLLLGDLWGNWRLDKGCAAVFEIEAWPPAAGTARLQKLLSP